MPDDVPIVPQVPLVDSNTDAASRQKPRAPASPAPTYGEVIASRAKSNAIKWVLGGLLLWGLASKPRARRRRR